MAGRYRTYPGYKASGIEWLGDIPKEWAILQSRRMFDQRKERARDGDEQLTASQKYGVIPQKKFMALEDQKVMQVVTGSEILKHVEPDDFVISMRSFQGGLEHSKYVGCVSSAYVGLIPKKHVVPAFFKYLFKSRRYIQALQSTSNLVRDGQALRFDNFAQVPLPKVSELEQTQIAAFLDHETAKIDALIAKQQRLIALLEEKRQAVISHAVTKGLNPDAPLRPSGIDWLGDVPANWEVAKVKHAYRNLDSIRIPLSTLERAEMQGEFPYYGASGIIDYVDDFLFDEPLVLVSEDGANLLARSTPIAFTATGRYWVNNHAHILRPMDQNTEFWAEAIENNNLTPFVTGSAQPKFTSEALSNLPVVYPRGNSERALLNKFIIDQKRQFARTLTKAKSAINLLKERRTALISAAVTGKIDVRDWTPPEAKEIAA